MLHQKLEDLGGDIGDVADIIIGVAEASRRNVVATTEHVEKLYASSKVLGLETKTLVKFLDVGAGIETIPETRRIYSIYPKYRW
jgi:hypothetical protein